MFLVEAAASAALPGAPEAAAATPLEQRQWRRQAQRAVRLAVTAFKDGRGRFRDATSTGTAAATRLTNLLLQQLHAPATCAAGLLAGVAGLELAVVGKLRRLAAAELAELRGCVEAMQGALAAMDAGVRDVQACYQEAAAVVVAPVVEGDGGGTSAQRGPAANCSSISGTTQVAISAGGGGLLDECQLPSQVQQPELQAPAIRAGEHAAAAGEEAAAPSAPAAGHPAAGAATAPPAWCATAPVFHSLALPDIARLLQQLAAMHARELRVRRQLLDTFSDAVALAAGADLPPLDPQPGPVAAPAAAAATGAALARAREPEQMRRHLTVAITTWMAAPFIEDADASHVLQMLTDEMSGF